MMNADECSAECAVLACKRSPPSIETFTTYVKSDKFRMYMVAS